MVKKNPNYEYTIKIIIIKRECLFILYQVKKKILNNHPRERTLSQGGNSREEKLDFISTSGVYKTPFSLIIILQLCVGVYVLILVNLWYLNSLYYLLTSEQFYPIEPKGYWFYWLLLPLNIYANLFLFAFTIIGFSALLIKILNKLCPIKEGVFEVGSKDWKYTHRRFWTAYFPIWLSRALPLPWLDTIAYKMLGARIGPNIVMYEGYIDPFLVNIGKNTMTSLHVCIFSHLIYHDKVYVKEVMIGENCIIGPQTVISPGTFIEDGAVLGANSYTDVSQRLEKDLIHIGTPVDKTFSIQTIEESQEKYDKIRKSE